MSTETTAPKLKKADVETLYEERQGLLKYLNPPKPNPAIWPPAGWQPHPQNPELYFRCITAEDLIEELYGSPEKAAWLESAQERIEEIDISLTSYFFPKKKPEGIQREEKIGYTATLKAGLDRKFDLPVVAEVVENCLAIAEKENLEVEIEDNVLTWEPKLDLTAFRNLPVKIQKAFEACLVITPQKEKFEIVKMP